MTDHQPPEPVLTQRLADALAYAIEIHAHQARKLGTIPYVSHLLATCAVVLENGGSEDQAVAALLHDAAEDGPENVEGLTAVSILATIAERFGQPVADIVRGCSDTVEHPKPAWEVRKQRYLEHLREAAPDIVLVSAADKLHNLLSIGADYRILGDEVFDRFNASADRVRWYYRNLVQVFSDRLGETHPHLVAELRRGLDAIDVGTT
jgi:(p)ppGpp synthase/HD superfamily hydrolase